VVVAELPGVKKEEIQIHATPCKVTISADTMERKYRKELDLPLETDLNQSKPRTKTGYFCCAWRNLLTRNLSINSFMVLFLK